MSDNLKRSRIVLFFVLIMAVLCFVASAEATEIKPGSFSNDATLREITIYETVKAIESEAFANCENLQVFKCLSMDVVIEDDAFDNDDNLTIICYSKSSIAQYAKAHGIPCQYLDAFEISCNTVNNGCVGLPITWTITDVMPGEFVVSDFSYELLCDEKIVDSGDLPKNLTYTWTPATAGTYTFRVTIQNTITTTTLSAHSVNVAAKLYMGTYEQDNNANTQDPLEWRVLSVSGNKALVLSEKIIKTNSFFNPYWIKYKYTYWAKSYIGSESVNYRGSAPESPERRITGISPTSIPLVDGTRGTEDDLFPVHARYWCNTTFYNSAFTDEEKERILLTHNTNEDNTDFNIKGGPDTYDHVFFLSYKEVLAYMPTENDRKAVNTATALKELGSGKPVYWWLRSPGQFRVNAMYVYAGTGKISVHGSDVGHSALGYRPAMWITIGG